MTPVNFKNHKIAICIPARDQVQTIFAYHLIRLVQRCNKIGLANEVFIQTGSLISKQRQELSQVAIQAGCTHILWLDSDMSFPPDIAENLLKHEVDIVAANYSTRSSPRKGVAYKKIGKWETWLKPNEISPRLQEVEGVGMGCMMVNTKVFSKLPKPWFEVSWVPEWNEFIGEDFYFCSLVKEYDFKVYIDTHLNKNLKHIGITEFTLQTVDITIK
jgi:hypothetical protein